MRLAYLSRHPTWVWLSLSRLGVSYRPMAVPDDASSALNRLANWQVAVLALYSLGGASARWRSEDVALKCYDLAPRRFGWGEHPQLEPARMALRDAKKPKHGALVAGDEAKGWLLTEEGLAWCEGNAERLGAGKPRRGLTALGEPEARALRQLGAHRLFQQWKRDEHTMAFYEVADALGFPADAPRAVVSRRIEELAGAAQVAGMDDLKGFVEWLRRSIGS